MMQIKNGILKFKWILKTKNGIKKQGIKIQKGGKNHPNKYKFGFRSLIFVIVLILIVIVFIIFFVNNSKTIKLFTIIGPILVLLTITGFTFPIKNSYDLKQAKTTENVKRRVRIKMLKEQNEYFQTVGLEFYLLFQSKSNGIFTFRTLKKDPHLYLIGESFYFDEYITKPGLFFMLEKNLEFSEYNDAGEKYKTKTSQNANYEFLFKLKYGLKKDPFCQKNAFFIILQNKQNEINDLSSTELHEAEFDYECKILQKGLDKQALFVKILKKFNFGLNNITFVCEVIASYEKNSKKQNYVAQLFFAMGKILRGKTKNFEEILLNLSFLEQQIDYFETANLNEPEEFTFKLFNGATNILEPNDLDKLTGNYKTFLRCVNEIEKIEQNTD